MLNVNKNTRFDISEWMNFLKGFAIFEVVFFHFVADQSKSVVTLHGAINSGYAAIYHFLDILVIVGSRIGSQGIHVFFFLSGVGIALSERKGMTTWKNFIVRRLSKIYPPYMVAVIFVITFQLFSKMEYLDGNYAWSILSSVLLVRNFSSEWIVSINGNWWFVAAIVQMYIAYILVRKWMSKGGEGCLALAYLTSFSYKVILIVLVSNGWLYFDAGVLNPYTSFFLNYWWEFVAGFIFVKIGAQKWFSDVSVAKLILLLLTGIFCEISGWFLSQSSTGRLFNDDLFAIGQISVITLIFLVYKILFARNGRLINYVLYVGAGSYGLYLVHHPISKAIVYFGFGMPNIFFVLALFAVYFPISFWAGSLIEKTPKLFFSMRGTVK